MGKKYLILFLSLVSLSGYLLISVQNEYVGFPLDDAWIHQTYARNLIYRGEWSFYPGEPSGGSTAPLWTGFLSIGYIFRLNPVLWNFVLGILLLSSLAYFGRQLGGALFAKNSSHILLGGLVLIFEWHFVWAALSGMETLFLAVVALFVFNAIARGIQAPLGIGLVIGLSTWVRPDGITLLGPAILGLYFQHGSWKSLFQKIFLVAAGFVIIFIPYLLFNLYLSGSIWPNTFFAKQAEYAVLRQVPFIVRVLDQVQLPLIGVGILLLPGFIYQVFWAVKKQDWGFILAVVWYLGFIGIYSWRLPVTYQHGRYLIPAMPIFFVGGVVGMLNWVKGSQKRWRRMLGSSWLVSTYLVLIGFWVLGGFSFAEDVAIIESEMVKTAKWISENTEPEAIIAAHDIGAMGYYSERRLLDLAGLISPEVIDFIRDEEQLSRFIDQNHADYLVTLENWYPQLESQARVIYKTGSYHSLQAGGRNMVVYEWHSP